MNALARGEPYLVQSQKKRDGNSVRLTFKALPCSKPSRLLRLAISHFQHSPSTEVILAMAQNWQIRLAETLTYISQIHGISQPQLAQLRQDATQYGQAQSDLISLGGWRPNPNPQETSRRKALRGLLLCLIWAGVTGQIGAAKRHYQNAQEHDIRDAIASFFPVLGATAQNVVNIARQVAAQGSAGGAVWDGTAVFKFRRGAAESMNLLRDIACYEGVNFFLYLGGVVSLRWLLAHGSQPGAVLPPQWNWGQPIDRPTPVELSTAGLFYRFHRPPSGMGLHYTLSVGAGQCVGCHNTQDVILGWLPNYGPRPSALLSQFSIDGYLSTAKEMVFRIPGGRQFEDKPRELGLRSAPCVPNSPF